MSAASLPRLRSLTLTLTERCTLRCTYCHTPSDRGRVMSDDVIDASVDLLARHADGPDVVLSFYGGEPFLALGGVRRAVDRGHAALGHRLRVLAPTNGLAIRDQALAFCREAGVKLAISIDGDTAERCFPDGRPSTPALLERLPDMFAAAGEGGLRLLARMTVTPANVGSLASNVRMLARLGFRRIIPQAAFEENWDDDAVAAWGREHRRIETWLAGARSVGLAVPDLPGLRAIEDRLARGAPRRSCGAGDRVAAVSTDGGLYPCYRLVFSDDPDCRLGDVEHGFTNDAAVARFHGFNPSAMRPEEGECGSCPSRDGCTHACPALGWTELGDVAAVPAVACRLMRAQVEAVRSFAPRRGQRRIATALVAAAMTGTAMAAAACASTVETASGGGTSVIAEPDASYSDASGGGICKSDDAGGGGICPVWFDSGVADDSGGGGGLCDTLPDASGGGGICPNAEPDAGGGPTPDAGGGGGGICPTPKADADAGNGGGGIC